LVIGVKLTIIGMAIDDPWMRYYGLGIDQDLDPYFWRTQEHKIRKVVWGSFADELEVPDRTKYVVVGVSAWVGKWRVKVYVNDRLVAEGYVAVPDAYPGSPGYLKASLAAPPPTPPTPPAVARAPVVAVLGPVLLGSAMTALATRARG